MAEEIADTYDAAIAEADRIEADAEARWLQQIEYPTKDLWEAEDRYWRIVAPYQAQHDAEFRRAQKLRDEAYANLRAGIALHEREHGQFISALLAAGSKEEMVKVLKLRSKLEEGDK